MCVAGCARTYGRVRQICCTRWIAGPPCGSLRFCVPVALIAHDESFAAHVGTVAAEQRAVTTICAFRIAPPPQAQLRQGATPSSGHEPRWHLRTLTLIWKASGP